MDKNCFIENNLLVGLTKAGFLAMKLDMNKAYDKVEWKFLRKVMEKLGFAEKWISIVMKCIKSVRFSVLVNGTPHEEFRPKKSIRQGDPLSPYLFLLCAEGLSTMLNMEESLNNFKGLKINRYCPSLTHLFFADDNIIFCRAEEQDCETIKKILEDYAKASGQTMKLNKSSFMVSKNVNLPKADHLSRILGIAKADELGEYLGMPSQTGRNKSRVFKKIKDKVWKALQSWKGKLFSAGGKEILLKSIAQAIPVYTMSCFKLPTSICEEINRACANFWWGDYKGSRKAHWIS